MSVDHDRVGNRLHELEREWDVDRAIEIESSLMGLTGLALGAWVRPALLALPLFVGSAVLTHALTGRYPLMPLFRRMGLRTSREIQRERYALKALRGDFTAMAPDARGDERSVATVASAGANGIQPEERPMRPERLPATSTRVERNTPSEVNELIRSQTDARLARLERGEAVELRARLAELDREWDVERVLQANASTLVILGTLLGAKAHRRFLLLPAAVLTFFAQHALQGWCPPLPILRRRGVRAAREIERERYAVKALRGDFDSIPRSPPVDVQQRVRAVLAAVDA